MAGDWLSAFKPGELTKLTDPGGNSLTLLEYNGIYFPPFPNIRQRLINLPSLKARDDDVVISAYPKSGTHWTWEMVNMIQRQDAKDSGKEKVEQFLEMVDTEVIDNQPSPRVLNAHIRPSLYPTDFVNKKVKIIYLMRDPRDVYVSFYHHAHSIKPYNYNGQWKDYFELAVKGTIESNSWMDYTLDWEKFFNDHPDIPVLTLYYEDSKQDLRSTVKKLASFLGYDMNDSLCQAIVDACTFDKMKANKVASYPEALKPHWRSGTYTMYRKGKSGDWVNTFTVAQQERFDAEYNTKMKNSVHFDRYRYK